MAFSQRHSSGLMIFFTAGFSFLLAACLFGNKDNQAAQQTVTSFYQTYLSVRPSGVPSAKDLQKFQPYLSASLAEQLKQAGLAEQKYAKATKGEVPPLVEGDLFTSLFEGAGTFAVLSCNSKDATGSCVVQLGYTDPSDKSLHQWKDKAYVVREGNGWRVDDIEFDGNWEFMHKGRLRDLLMDVIKEGNSDPGVDQGKEESGTQD